MNTSRTEPGNMTSDIHRGLPDGRAGVTQPQRVDASRSNDRARFRSLGKAPLRLWCLSFAGIALLTAGIYQAAADDNPFSETIQAQILSSVGNPDGTADQIFAGTGTARHAGVITCLIYVHVGVGSYDAAANAWVTPLSGSKTIAAANGDTLYSEFTGAEITEFDANGNPQPPPLNFRATQQVLAGTGRFQGASGSLKTAGLDYGNGTISFTSTGDVSLGEGEEGAGPVVVRILDLAYPRPPAVEVENAPGGWDFCPCANLGVIDPANEDGGLITLFGVDRNGSINEPNEAGWRFIDPALPQPTCKSAMDIIWIQHDFSGPFNNGDLQVAFNSALPGRYYSNPAVCPSGDISLGPLTYKWQLVYADRTVVVLFKAQR